MDCRGKRGTERTNKESVSSILRKSWYRLRLSVRDPTRVPTWDAIVLTAASPEQAQLYEWQLRRAKRMGRIADSTVTLVVPDPDGVRIGSGAATLHAIAVLSGHFRRTGAGSDVIQPCSQRMTLYKHSNTHESPGNEFLFMKEKHILLLHAGGDSKRVPWANPMGKVFLPLPFLAADDPDGPVPLLFDHILAISSCARQAFKNEGGIFIMTGDVLPCFETSSMILPEDVACIITVPTTIDIASNHGVIVAAKNGNFEKNYSLSLVENILQKPNLMELVENCAIGFDGRVLLDTGVIALRGKAWTEFLAFTDSSQWIISELLKTKTEISLYEDIVAAWVPSRHEWLMQRPMGAQIIDGLGNQKMFSYCDYNLSFLHFGTSSEVLEHLCGYNSGLVGRRHLCLVPATKQCDIAESAIILSSNIEAGTSIGDDTIVYDSSLSGKIQIGSQSIIVGVNISGKGYANGEPVEFVLPNRHCLWQVPLIGVSERPLIFCGLNDNPKKSFAGDGTFCGRPWIKVLHDLDIQENELWPSCTSFKCLWNAKIYPILPCFEMLSLAMWLIGVKNHNKGSMLPLWRRSTRISLEELHRSIDFPRIWSYSNDHQADLVAGIVKASVNYGLLGRNVSQLCKEILEKGISGMGICKDFLELCSAHGTENLGIVPLSRKYQLQQDLLRTCGDETSACIMEQKVWNAVANETASAVEYGFGNHSNSSTRGYDVSICHPRTARVELPVRVDFVGGWSDTPPWSLERSGCVLNMAVCLNGQLPLGTEIETTASMGISISDDMDNELFIKEPISITPSFDENDPFRLVKSALIVTGIIHEKSLQSIGLHIRTWANVPRGSGLGTSSILAAAVVKALLHIMNGDGSNENVAGLVLVLEQIMGTGGGWQDQIGGLYPGIKCTTSSPEKPLNLRVITLVISPQFLSELEQRLLVVFTGRVRLANQVLQKVVIRYLRRDNLLVSSIRRLSELAKIGQEALINGDFDGLGEIMLEAWRLHQELDPYCSSEFLDKLLEFSNPYCSGYKLVGAGGGGFALLLAKDVNSARQLRRLLEDSSDFDVKVYDWSIYLDNASKEMK